MSNQTNSNQHSSNEDSQKNIEELTDDLDFWNIDTDQNGSDSDSDALAELEKILAEQEANEPEVIKSSQETSSEIQYKKGEFRAIDQSCKTTAVSDSNESPDHDINILLANATAKISAEREMKESLSFSNDEETKKQKEPYQKSSLENIAIRFCYISIVAVFTYLIIYASKQHNFDPSKPYASNTPAKGEYASVESIETWWSEPAGKNAKLGVLLVPSATITLSSDSKSGVIRSVFFSYEESLLGQLKPKGDPLTHEFIDGKFLESGTNQITIYCTDGYEDLAHYAFYRSQDEKRWTIEVREAPSIQTSVDGFKPLANAPIEPIQK